MLSVNDSSTGGQKEGIHPHSGANEDLEQSASALPSYVHAASYSDLLGCSAAASLDSRFPPGSPPAVRRRTPSMADDEIVNLQDAATFGLPVSFYRHAPADDIMESANRRPVPELAPRTCPELCDPRFFGSDARVHIQEPTGYCLDPGFQDVEDLTSGTYTFDGSYDTHDHLSLHANGPLDLHYDGMHSDGRGFTPYGDYKSPDVRVKLEAPFGVPVDIDDPINDEPYAKLIYRALMSVPSHSMVLQDIYRWFMENTDKGSQASSGWKNSIRHNLSMNAAFRKHERRVSGDDSKKLTEWVLEPFAITEGVKSTTRYRKPLTGKKVSRSEAAAPLRQSSGRKGGIKTGQAKSMRLRSAREADAFRAHQVEHLGSNAPDVSAPSGLMHFSQEPAVDALADPYGQLSHPRFPEDMRQSQLPYYGRDTAASAYDASPTEGNDGGDYSLRSVAGVYTGSDVPVFCDDDDERAMSAMESGDTDGWYSLMY